MLGNRPLLLAILLFLAGCSSFKPPGIAVLDATLVESTDEASRFDVRLDIANVNNEPLELREFSYSFTLAGGRPYTGRWAMGRTLAPGHRSEVTLPAVVVVDPAKGPAPAWTIRGHVLYVTSGALAELLLDAEVRKPRARFAGKGTVEVAGAGGP